MGSFILKLFGLLLAVLVGAFVYLYFMAPGTTARLLYEAQLRGLGMTESQVQVGDFNMTYIRGGQGEPLLMVHGFGADRTSWLAIAPYLTDRFEIIAPDLPGFGKTDHPMGADYRVTTQVDRLRDFARAIGLEKFHLAGNSMGGAIAGTFAGRYPEQVSSLWLLAPAFVQSAPMSEFGRRLTQGGPNPLLPASHDQFDAVVDWVFAEPPYIPAPVQYHLADTAIERRPLLQDIFDQINAEKLVLETKLKGSTVPSLVMWGDQDRLLHVAGAGILDDALANSRMVVLEGIGHVPMMEAPEKAAQAFKAFESELGAPAASQ